MRRPSLYTKLSDKVLSSIDTLKIDPSAICWHFQVSTMLLMLIAVICLAMAQPHLTNSIIVLHIALISSCSKSQRLIKFKTMLIVSSYAIILKYFSIVFFGKCTSCIIVISYLLIAKDYLWKSSFKGIQLFFVPLACLEDNNSDYNSCMVIIALIIILLSAFYGNKFDEIKYKLENIIEQGTQKVQEIVERISEGILIYTESEVIYSNKTLRRILNAESNKEVLAKFSKIVKETGDGTLVDEINKFLNSPNSSHFLPADYKSPETTHRKIRLIGYQFVDNIKRIKLEVSGFEANIIDQKTLLIIMRDRTVKSELEEAKIGENYRMLILSSVSHELLTPLNGILGLLPGLISSTFSANEKSLLNMIYCNANVLLYVIHDIHDFVDMESNKFYLSKKEESPMVLICEVVEMVSPLAKERGISIITNVDNNLSKAYIDARRLKQIIFNLLTNAIKYSHEKGTINIISEIVKQGNDKIINISVTDYGVGMEKQKLESLFKINSRFEITKTAGIGLTVSNKIVEKMGGTFHATSQLNQGSTFSFTIPLQKDQIIHIYSTPMIKPRILAKITSSKKNNISLYSTNKVRQELAEVSSTRNCDSNLHEIDEDEEGGSIEPNETSIKPKLINDDILDEHSAETLTPNVNSSNLNLINKDSQTSSFNNLRGDTDSAPGSEESTPQLIKKVEAFGSIKKSLCHYNHKCGCPIVMAVDDTSYNRLAFSIMADGLGVRHCEASSGDEAISLINTHNNKSCCDGIKVIFMDLEMPGKNGFETGAIILSMVKEQKIKPCIVVALTSFSGNDYIKGCFNVGMKDFCKFII